MIRFNLLRAAALLVLCALLATPLTAAPKFRCESSTPAAADGLFGWLRSGFSLIWSKAGCQIDPFGHCGTVKNGCQIDPHGRCLDKAKTPTNTKNGCQLDPNGRCIG